MKVEYLLLRGKPNENKRFRDLVTTHNRWVASGVVGVLKKDLLLVVQSADTTCVSNKTRPSKEPQLGMLDDEIGYYNLFYKSPYYPIEQKENQAGIHFKMATIGVIYFATINSEKEEAKRTILRKALSQTLLRKWRKSDIELKDSRVRCDVLLKNRKIIGMDTMQIGNRIHYWAGLQNQFGPEEEKLIDKIMRDRGDPHWNESHGKIHGIGAAEIDAHDLVRNLQKQCDAVYG